MLDAVRHAHAKGATLYIVSDANTAFIEAFLRDQGILHIFEAIISNKSILNTGRFVVQPYHDFENLGPHGCPMCPPNM
jgi:phosphoserine phosphatase